jgi:hypothetical protein
MSTATRPCCFALLSLSWLLIPSQSTTVLDKERPAAHLLERPPSSAQPASSATAAAATSLSACEAGFLAHFVPCDERFNPLVPATRSKPDDRSPPTDAEAQQAVGAAALALDRQARTKTLAECIVNATKLFVACNGGDIHGVDRVVQALQAEAEQRALPHALLQEWGLYTPTPLRELTPPDFQRYIQEANRKKLAAATATARDMLSRRAQANVLAILTAYRKARAARVPQPPPGPP